MINWAERDPNLGTALGVCVYPLRQIVVRPSHPYNREVLMHEVLHACWWETHLPEQGEMDLGGLLGEAVVSHLAPALLRTLIDSPQLRAYLLEER
ncbi:MAG: hypothetical protein ACO3S5_13080 [Ilumatobacteraceae bacterium]